MSPTSEARASISACGLAVLAKIAGTPACLTVAARAASSAELGSARVDPPGITVPATE